MSGDVLIEFLSADGHAQALGANAFGLGLLTHGAITLVNDNQTHPQPMVVGQVTVAGVNPVLAFKANQQVNVYGAANSGGSFTFYFRAQSSVALGLQYWVFDTATQAMRDPTLADVEAAIFDEYGVKTFDLTMLFMKVADVIETPSPPNEIPFGFGGGSLGEHVDLAVPAGRTYAIVQSTPFFLNTTYDTGAYGTGQYPPELNIGDGEPPLGMTWRYQTLESYFSTGGYVNGSTIRAGITRFEFWQQWNPRGATPHLNMDGECRHLVIDVTGLPSTPLPNPNTPNVAISAASRSVSVSSATNATTDTPAVSITISGGAAPYSINWVRQSGSTAVVPAGSSTTTSFSTRVTNQVPGTSVSAIYVANVTDALGATRSSDPVTFTHTVGAVDKAPDPVTLNGMSPTTTGNVLGDTASNAIQIAGINASITLRWERYAAAGSIDAITVVVQKAASASGPWTDVGSFNPLLGGYQYADAPANNGDWFRYVIRGAATNAGRKVYTFNLTVWNLDLNNQIAADRPVSITVDSDDNYYQPDFTPDLIDWANISGSTNDATFFGGNAAQTIAGINQTITVRATISNVVKTGNIVFNSRLDVHRNSSYAHDTTTLNNGAWAETTVTNGQTLQFYAHAGTSAGTAAISYTVTVTNVTTGAILDTFTVNQTVDADNNYNVAPTPDYTLDPIGVGDLSLYTNEPSGLTNASFFQVTGINQSVVLRFTRGNQWDSGGIFTRRLYIYHSTVGSGGPWTEYAIGAGANGTADITVNNGHWFYVQAYCDTTAGIGQTSFTAYIANQTTGGNRIASFNVSATVDADNNYGVSAPPSVALDRYYFDQWEYADQGQTHTVYVGRTNITISGGQSPFHYSWERQGGLGGWSVGSYTTYADFYYTGRTNFSNSANYRLKITDAQNRVAYSDWVSVTAAAGNIQN